MLAVVLASSDFAGLASTALVVSGDCAVFHREIWTPRQERGLLQMSTSGLPLRAPSEQSSKELVNVSLADAGPEHRAEEARDDHRGYDRD